MEHLTVDGRFDLVYLVVSPQSPFKESERALSASRRYRAACDAVKRHPELKVKVDPIELGMEPPQYTVRTLDALKQREPGNEFTLVVGADNLESMRRWKDYSRILTEYGIIVFPRGDADLEALKADLLEESSDYKIEIAEAPLVDVSSSEIREALAEGRDVSGLLM